MRLIADNIHGLNPLVSDAMKRLDPGPIRDLARRCEESAADLIDINPGYLSKRNEDRMAFLVQTVEEASSKPLVLDSPNPRLLALGLAACSHKPILNALSLEPAKIAELLPLAAEHETDLVILLMDERSFTPPTVEEKLALALEIFEHTRTAGLELDKLIFDPVLPNLSWDDVELRLREAVKTVRLLSSGAVFQAPARTMAGLSNLRSGMRSRVPFSVEERYLGVLAGAGLDFVLADVLRPEFADGYNAVNGMV